MVRLFFAGKTLSARMASRTRLGSTAKNKENGDSVKCLFCPAAISTNTHALNCDICKHWICLSCSKVSQSMYKEITRKDEDIVGNSDFSWSCVGCRNMIPDLKVINSNLLDLKKSNDARLESVEKRMTDLESNLGKTVKEEVEGAASVLAKTVSEKVEQTVGEMVEKRIKEIENRKARASNLVFFHVKMSLSEDSSQRKFDDLDIVQRLFSELFPSDPEFKIKACFRLMNKKKPSSDPLSTKPLKVICEHKDQRRKLLQESSRITDIDDPLLKNIVIVRDLTPEQRVENKKLYFEKLKMKKMGQSVVERFGNVIDIDEGEAGLGSPSQE